MSCYYQFKKHFADDRIKQFTSTRPFNRRVAKVAIWEMASPARLREKIRTRNERRRHAARKERAMIRAVGYRFALSQRRFRRELHEKGTADFTWRLFPYGAWKEASGDIVVFDRNYCPIVRLSDDKPFKIVQPQERIIWVEQRWFYEDAVSPPMDPDTEKLIGFIATHLGILGEIAIRVILTDYGDFERHDELKGWWLL